MAKKPESVRFEIELKVALYNRMVDDAVSLGYTAEMVEKDPSGKVITWKIAEAEASALAKAQVEVKQRSKTEGSWNKKGEG